ncbi:hypothetical protein NC652_018510 [Populus alba x Populus x berolinensis]|uniref:Uncharacterized protein n=1 Tax=Populus alba x Populus x berolinensis TaxID=444605 RepID=A0AAD6VV53_9ROSI|nr:hypothetical protein NC652_018510 [Populus alba x Populus x berolinensis]KAJ6989865.1 hypothetical protein NC653_018386 [Populus alba x Populus x berolinensis]
MSCTRQEQNGRSLRTYPQIANHNVGVHARTRGNRHNGRDQSESSVTIYGVIEDPQKAQKHSLKESYKELVRNVGDFSNDP